MRVALLSITFLLLCSCDYFDKKKVTTEEILEEELESFNWNDVDQYPTFKSCDSVSGKEKKRNCFESTLGNIVSSNLAQQTIIVDENVDDEIKLTLKIDKTGALHINAIDMKPTTMQQIPTLDSLLRNSLESLPKIYPAIKRSQQVATEFVLPIKIRIQ